MLKFPGPCKAKSVLKDSLATKNNYLCLVVKKKRYKSQAIYENKCFAFWTKKRLDVSHTPEPFLSSNPRNFSYLPFYQGGIEPSLIKGDVFFFVLAFCTYFLINNIVIYLTHSFIRSFLHSTTHLPCFFLVCLYY